MLNYKPYKVNIDAIDRSEFSVTEREGKWLITPLKSKHRWAPNELVLRSLLTDRDGLVLSSGWPKFFNIGEDQATDASFHAAVAKRMVYTAEKLDGSLIVVDMIHDKLNIRTRGNHTLGDFDDAVRPLFTKNDQLMNYLKRNSGRESFLFEYVGPGNQIVVKYEEPKLYLLGTVNKATLRPTVHPGAVARWAEKLGVEAAPTLIQFDIESFLANVRTRGPGSEGVVVHWYDEEGRLWLAKVKSAWYMTMHSVRFRFTPDKASRLAFLMDVRSEADFTRRLNDEGMDWEAAKYAVSQLPADHWTDVSRAEATAHTALTAFRALKVGQSVRKDYVNGLRHHLNGMVHEHLLFQFGMKVFDERESVRALVGAMVFDESMTTIERECAAADTTINALLFKPAPEESDE